MASRTSNLAIRLATAAVCVPIILGLLYRAPPWAFYLLVVAVALVGVRELFAMTHPGDAAAQAVGVVVSAAASAAVFFHGDDARTLVTVLVGGPDGRPALHAGRASAPIETAALRACALGLRPALRRRPAHAARADAPHARGRRRARAWSSCALGLAWFADTSAYFAGRFLGTHKLYEAVSPKKTVEGAIGGLLGSVVWALLGSLWFLRGSLPLAHAVPLALVGGVLGQAGDLAESLLKRSTGDQGLRRHRPRPRGLLDRVDALLMTSVVVFLYTQWIGLS